MGRKPSTRDELGYVPMKGSKPLPFQFKNIIDIVLMIQNHGELEKFARHVKKLGLEVLIPAKTVNSVKEYVANNEDLRKDRVGKKVIGPKKMPAATREVVSRAAPPRSRDPFRDCCGF